ncbi:MAG: hypothetical protein K0Q73_5212 [Paenibacillus sp.]|jgi:hypothetical protein|nr:hypothetical protein [Paenibacillus sp.]
MKFAETPVKLDIVQAVNLYQVSISELIQTIRWYSTTLAGNDALYVLQDYNNYSRQVVGERLSRTLRTYEMAYGFEQRPHREIMLVQNGKSYERLENYLELRRKEAVWILSRLQYYSKTPIGTRALKAIQSVSGALGISNFK